jgi:predicted TIM-barrel fold metal-dependent hydrolase
VLIGHDVFHGYDNSCMLDAARRYPGKFAICALIDDRDATTPPADLMRSLLAQGVSGFRIDPFPKGKAMLDSANRRADWLESEGMASMWACAAETRQAMCCLIDPSDIPDVDAMCSRFSTTPVVIDHFARIGVSGVVEEDDLASLCALARHPEVCVKLSAFYALGKKQPPYRDLAPMIERLLGAFGASRLMWATDCPYQLTGAAAGLDGPTEVVRHTYADSLALIQPSGGGGGSSGGLPFLTDEDREAILWKTAERVFFSVLPQ